MRQSRFTESQIIGIIKEQAAGMPTAEMCRKHGLSQGTFYKSSAIRVDNGPEYVSARLQNCAKKAGIGLIYIQPGRAQQNAYVERYNRTVRTEWLGRYHFETIEEMQGNATSWLWTLQQ